MIAKSIKWPAKEAPLKATMLRCSINTVMTLRRRRALSSSISMPFEGSRRSRYQPVARRGDVGKQFNGSRRQDMNGLRIRLAPAAAYGRIAEECYARASMRGIDCGCETCFFGNKAGDCKASNPRNNVVKELIGVAGRLLPFEHHIGPLWLKT